MKTTKKQFEIFKKEVEGLLIEYGLLSWEKNIEHTKLNDDTIAGTATNIEARNFTIMLNTEPPYKLSSKDLKHSAHHEVLEVFFCKIEDMVCEANINRAREEIHAMTQTLINRG